MQTKPTYNVITKYSGGGVAKHRNVSNVKGFIQYMSREYLAHTMFFYDHITKEYRGYWKKHMSPQIH
ncbi:hypothetical protein [Sediminibacterium sp.]|uniref:hypothetical protein n=1 Tax=Sediminibacterium sp. TaxID=1917865 RepID=UPI003F70AA9E